MRVQRHRIFTAGLILVVLGAGFTVAGDGVIEINHARALAGGVTPGDGAGYPVTISTSGSYLLTGDLTSSGGGGIRIDSDDVTVDLNGFTLNGAGVSGNGIYVTDGVNVEVRNGIVRGFLGRGVSVASFNGKDAVASARMINLRVVGSGVNGIELDAFGGLVRGCTVLDAGFWGIRVDAGSTVIDNVVRNSNQEGIYVLDASYRGNVLSENNGGNANSQVLNIGGLNLGQNACGTSLCP